MPETRPNPPRTHPLQPGRAAAYTRVIVPLDQTPQAAEAIHPAAALATEFGASLHLVTIRKAPEDATPRERRRANRRPPSPAELEMKRQLRLTWTCPVHTGRVEAEAVTDALKEYAEGIRADLAVVGVEPAPSAAPGLAESVAFHLLEEVVCPVLIVPSGAEETPPLQGPVRAVAAGLDPGGDGTGPVLGHAVKLARAWDADVTVSRVARRGGAPHGPAHPSAPGGGLPPRSGGTSAPAGKSTADGLDEIVTDLRRRALSARARTLHGSGTWRELLDQAAEDGASIVVISRASSPARTGTLFAEGPRGNQRDAPLPCVLICPTHAD